MSHSIALARCRALAIRTAAVASLLGLAALPGRAQPTRTASAGERDSVSFIVARRTPRAAEPSIATRDGGVALLVRDSIVVLQLTDDGMRRLFDRDTVSRGVGGAIVGAMMRAGVSGMMNHGIAYRLSGLRRAYASGSRLVLEGHDGGHVFEDTSLNGHRPMEEFRPADATRFAAAVNRAIAAR